MKFIIDSNIFIQTHKDLPCDIWCSFWNNFETLLGSGDVVSIAKVYDEISRGNDDLLSWVNQHTSKDIFIEIDNDVMMCYAELIKWANSQNFTQTACDTFADVADSYLIATAKAKGLVVVTLEKSNPDSKKRIKIPDACAAVGVRCIDLNTMLREMNVQI